MVKVRFAPSPTGYMHIGNARIAIVNYLFCKKNDGHFLFRLDDTDSERSKKEYEEAILRDLAWLGIQYDSSYKQSGRTARYSEVRDQLLESGLLYKCYESQKELEHQRKLAISRGKPPIYDRSSHKDGNDGATSPYIRFKLPRKTIQWNDIIMGPISYDLANVSDPVVIKADGTFLYTFSSVIDDIDDDITHIIRGQDHTTNTAIHIAMFDEITGNRYKPNFAHLSLLVNKDGSQFSKRLGSYNLSDIRGEHEIEPLTMMNMLSTLGSSVDTTPLTSIEQIIDQFDITKFSTNSPKFDINDLINLNKKVIHKYSYSEICSKVQNAPSVEVYNAVHENVNSLSDFELWNNIFSEKFRLSHQFTIEEKEAIKAAVMDCDNVHDWIQRTSAKVLVRIALTGLRYGPNITEICKILEKQEVMRRLNEAISNT